VHFLPEMPAPAAVLVAASMRNALPSRPGCLASAQNPFGGRGSGQANPAVPESTPFVNCPSGGPLGAIDLRVEAGASPLLFHTPDTDIYR
jgi:hypothetical protein